MELHLLVVKTQDDRIWKAYCMQTPGIVGIGRGPDSSEMDLGHDIATAYWERGEAIFGEPDASFKRMWREADDQDRPLSWIDFKQPETNVKLRVRFSKRRILENV